MQSDHYETVIDELVARCGDGATKADLARRIDALFPNATVRIQDVYNWRKRGIPLAKCDVIAHDFSYPKSRMRPDLPQIPDAAA